MIAHVFCAAINAFSCADAFAQPPFEPQGAQVWVDTDAACGVGPLKDVDDCLAILALTRAHGLKVAGVSTTFGNAPRATVDRVVADLLPLWPEHESAPPSIRGARHRGDCRSNAAAAGIVEASNNAPTIILALGPLTNIACAIETDPSVAARLKAVVFVGGARPGHVFHPAESARGAILFGHGPTISDMNVQKDAGAVARVLVSGVPFVLTPYELARQVEVDAAALDRLSTASPMAQEIARRARPWLSTWKKFLGRDGFYPFDVMAAVAVIAPQTLGCDAQIAVVTADTRISGNRFGPLRLLVGAEGEGNDAAEVLWCDRLADPAEGAPAVLHLLGASP